MRFSTSADRRLAVIERTRREATEKRLLREEQLAQACAEELRRCVALGLDWPAIRPRLALLAPIGGTA